MQKFDELLQKIVRIKMDYEGGAKINAATFSTLIMAGALDSLFDKPLTVQDRFAAIEAVKKAIKSKAALPKGRQGQIGIDEIEDEFSRNIWMTNVNPLFSFRVCDYYKEALEAMGFKPTGTQHLRYRKEQTETVKGQAVDVFGSFNSLFDPRTVARYSSKNNPRWPAVMGIYKGYTSQTYGDNRKYRKLKVHDGTTENEIVAWPEYGGSNFPRALDYAMNSYRGRACLFIGRITVSKRGYKSFSAWEIVPFM